MFSSTTTSTENDFGDDLFARECAFFEHPHYVDLGPIARGAYGDVRRVRDTRESRLLAMKVTRRCIAHESPTYLRFATEIEIMTSLQHEGILTSHDHGEFDDGRLWFTMPEIQGHTFAAALDEVHSFEGPARFRAPAFRRALMSFAHICEIVAFAHKQGIVHRDLKPKNMMIANENCAFVIDWGVAKRLPTGVPNGSTTPKSIRRQAYTQTGEVVGTPAYMPPEQALGDISSHSPASDVYSLGAVLYHLLAGEPPYRGTRAAVMSRIRKEAPKPLAERLGAEAIPLQGLVGLCESTMQRSLAKRVIGAQQMARELRDWLARNP